MKLNGIDVAVIQGDITTADTEAIVNAANNRFFMGGGVAGVIKQKGGKEIEKEAVAKGPLNVGESIITKAGKLKVKYVIHSVTMKMDFRTSPEIIRQAAYSALKCAQKNKITSIAFCALGCGTGGFSYHTAAKIIAQEVFKYTREIKKPTLERIVVYLYSSKALRDFERNFNKYLKYMVKKTNQGPFLTVDGIIKFQTGIVMVKRSNPPFGWALPGGFVDYGESAEAAVAREIKEETNLDFVRFSQFKVYSERVRDPRFHTASVVFSGEGKGKLLAGSDAQSAKVFKLDNLPKEIAFDHRMVVHDYFK